jgi:hypothetical protein
MIIARILLAIIYLALIFPTLHHLIMYGWVDVLKYNTWNVEYVRLSFIIFVISILLLFVVLSFKLLKIAEIID